MSTKIFGKKNSCSTCGYERYSGRAPRPLPKNSRDWNCPNCNFLIFGSKSSCNKCGTSRPTTTTTKIVCGICTEDINDIYVLNCGHSLCSSCDSQLTSCPFCRQPITNRVKLFQ